MAAALVETFLGILLCCDLVGPLSSNTAKIADDEHAYYHVLRGMLVGLLKGTAPNVAIKIGRRDIPGLVRPTFQETEAHIKNKDGAAQPEAAAAA